MGGMRVMPPTALVLSLALAATPGLASGNPAAARNAADSAMTRERFCEAAWLYRRLDELNADATITVKAAEALAQGGDRAGAAAVLEAFPVRFPGHPLAAAAAKRLDLIRTAIGKIGPGATCPAPAPVCGNGLVEANETCDDGNRVDADSCPATCIAVGTVAPVVTPPPTPTPAPPTPPPPTTTTATTPTTTPTTTAMPTTTPTTTSTPTTTPATTTTTTPTPEPEPEPPATVEPPPVAPTPVEPTPAEPVDDVAPAPIEDEVPAGPGPPIAGIALSTVGGLAAAAGTGAMVLGVLPAIAYFSGSGAQAAAAAEYRAADNNADRRAAAGAAADAYAAQANQAATWNNQGRWLLLGGTGGLAVGAGLLVGGILLIANHGGDVVDDDRDDDKDDD